jgi:hypothetical protein
MSTTRSLSSSEPITITFTNSSSETFKGYWVNFKGEECYYFDVHPGSQVAQNTFLSHVWAFKDSNNKTVHSFAATKKTAPDSVIDLSKLGAELESEKKKYVYQQPTITTVEPTLDEVQLPSDLKSTAWDKPATVTFNNLSSHDLEMSWIDYSGKSNPSGVLKNHESICQVTYDTHPFVFTDKITNKVVYYHITKGTGTFPIGKSSFTNVIATPVENEDETSCHPIMSKYERCGFRGICFGEEPDLFNELYHHLYSTKKKFVDEEFPPHVHWERACEIAGTDTRLYKSGIIPQDVLQGSIGNCWLMQAFAGAATMPEKLKQVFTYSMEERSHGLYIVRLNFEGRWVCILLDDYIPCDKFGSVKYARMSEPGEIWVCLLEKAFAKIGGGYNTLPGHKTSCSPSKALTYILSGKDRCVRLDSPDQQRLIEENKFWPTLEGWRNNGSVIVLSSVDEGTDGLINSRGMVSYHGYSIMDIRHFGSLILLRIRNTWGNTEWNGKFSDNSTEWEKYPMVKKELQSQGLLESKNDGIFWMDADSFFENFCLIWWNEMYH